MPPTSGGAEPMLALQSGRNGIQIGRSDDYVIDPHAARILRADRHAEDDCFSSEAVG